MNANTAARAAALLAVALAPAFSAAASLVQSGRLWRPAERILVTSCHQLGAVATDMRRVYAASDQGIQVYDFVARRWEAPITVEDGFPPGEQPSALAHDRSSDALWLGTMSGGLYVYHLAIARWERVAPVGAGPVLQIVPVSGVRDDGLFVAVPGAWLRMARGSIIAEPVPPDRLPREVRERGPASPDQDPFFAALRGTATLDENLRRWQITDVTPADRPARYWVATFGGNLFSVDTRFMTSERLTYGLLGRGVGALAFDGERLWFGGDGRGPRTGASSADTALQQWRSFEARIDAAPAGYVEAVLPTTRAVWFAAADGLFRFDRASDRWTRLTESDGMPSARTTALAPGAGGVWVGTRRGLTYVSEDGEVAGGTLLRGQRVNRLLNSADTLWIASDAGLWLIAGAGPARTAAALEPRPVPGIDSQPALLGRIVDVRPAFGELLALAPDALYRFDGRAWHGPLRDAAAGLGRLHAMAVAENQLWVAGDGGLARMDGESRAWTVYAVGQDIPEGPVRAVMPMGGHVWAATPAGALRLAWRR